jgi:hypothetical protein
LEWWWLRGIYSPHPPKQPLGQATVDGHTGQSGAPPDTVRCATRHCPVRQPRHPTIRVLTQSTVGAPNSGGTGQSGAAPDSHCSLSGAPLTSAVNCSTIKGTVQSTVAPKSRCSAITPDSPVNYNGARPQKPESGEFEFVRPWCTGHCLVRQTRALSRFLLL